MNNRLLLPDECIQILEAMPDADHEAYGYSDGPHMDSSHHG
jgi:hypothetical protein